MHELDNVSCSAPKLIIGYFNGCRLKTYLPTYKQYVTCATRNDKTIDLCYCNIKNAYKSVPKPPLGSSDHNIVQLIPAYKQLLKTGTVEEKTVTLWNDEGIEQLYLPVAGPVWFGESRSPSLSFLRHSCQGN